MASIPRKAPEAIRKSIVEALQDPKRRFLDLNTPSRHYLTLWGLREAGLYQDLAEGLRDDLLFLKPKTFPRQTQRYQCVLLYPEDSEFKSIVVHVTLSPKGDPPRVKIAVHPSDTLKTLPAIDTSSLP
jgi:hypothetical protein